jgi:ApaG protein
MKNNDLLYDIQVTVTSQYLSDQSDPASARFVFSYRVVINNRGRRPAKLLSRHWIITDAHQQVQEVRGAGVIGEQPTIAAGETYEYSSGCVLTTEVGTMEGSYRMVADDGVEFDADIPRFTLSLPRTLH